MTSAEPCTRLFDLPDDLLWEVHQRLDSLTQAEVPKVSERLLRLCLARRRACVAVDPAALSARTSLKKFLHQCSHVSLLIKETTPQTATVLPSWPPAGMPTFEAVVQLHLQGLVLSTPALRTFPNLSSLHLERCQLPAPPNPPQLLTGLPLHTLRLSSPSEPLLSTLLAQLPLLPSLTHFSLGPFLAQPPCQTLSLLPRHVTALTLHWRSAQGVLTPLGSDHLEQLHQNTHLHSLIITGSVEQCPSLAHLCSLRHFSVPCELPEAHFAALRTHQHITSLVTQGFAFAATGPHTPLRCGLRHLTITRRCVPISHMPRLPVTSPLQLSHPEVCLTLSADSLPTTFTFSAPHGIRLVPATAHPAAPQLTAILAHLVHASGCLTIARCSLGEEEGAALSHAAKKLGPGTTLRLEGCAVQDSFWPALRSFLLAGGLPEVQCLVVNECRGAGADVLCGGGWGDRQSNPSGRVLHVSIRGSTQGQVQPLMASLAGMMAHDGGVREIRRPDGWSVHFVLGLPVS